MRIIHNSVNGLDIGIDLEAIASRYKRPSSATRAIARAITNDPKRLYWAKVYDVNRWEHGKIRTGWVIMVYRKDADGAPNGLANYCSGWIETE